VYKSSANVVIDNAVAVRIQANRANTVFDCLPKLETQSGVPFFVPSKRDGEIALGLWPKDHLKFHSV